MKNFCTINYRTSTFYFNIETLSPLVFLALISNIVKNNVVILPQTEIEFYRYRDMGGETFHIDIIDIVMKSRSPMITGIVLVQQGGKNISQQTLAEFMDVLINLCSAEINNLQSLIQ